MNYKRVGSRLMFRCRHGCRGAMKMCAGLIAVCGTVFGLIQAAGISCNWKYVVSAVVGAILVSLIYGIVKARIDHLPDMVIVGDGGDERYELRYEERNNCSDFNRESAKYFGRDYIDDAVVESWRARNPRAFIYLRNGREDPCAALCIFGLRTSFMEEFIKGRLSEADIEPEDILDLTASRKADSLYLSAIIIIDPHSQVGHRRAIAMVWATIQYLKKVFGMRKTRRIYAVPVNKASENLLKRLGFQLSSREYSRKDRHDLYCFEMNADSIGKVLERVGDHSSYCTINLS